MRTTNFIAHSLNGCGKQSLLNNLSRWNLLSFVRSYNVEVLSLRVQAIFTLGWIKGENVYIYTFCGFISLSTQQQQLISNQIKLSFSLWNHVIYHFRCAHFYTRYHVAYTKYRKMKPQSEHSPSESHSSEWSRRILTLVEHNIKTSSNARTNTTFMRQNRRAVEREMNGQIEYFVWRNEIILPAQVSIVFQCNANGHCLAIEEICRNKFCTTKQRRM